MALVRQIETGTAYAGLLIDGGEGTPYVVATLPLTPDRGLLVEVPYATSTSAEQFASVQRWYDSGALPEASQSRGDELEVTLYGCRMSGRTRHLGRDLEVGRFVSGSAILALRALAKPFAIQTLRSRIDGLQEWTGFTARQ